MPQKMYTVRAGAELGIPGVEWVNHPPNTGENLGLPIGHIPDHGNRAQGVESGFWSMETPVFVIDRGKGRVPLADVEPAIGRDIWLISDRAKQVFQNVDPHAFEFIAVETRVRRDASEVVGPKYWLCDLVRFLDALDEEKSNADVRLLEDGTKRARRKLVGGEVLKSAMIGGSNHIFRLMHAPTSIYATETFVKAIRKARLTGITLGDGGRLDA